MTTDDKNTTASDANEIRGYPNDEGIPSPYALPPVDYSRFQPPTPPTPEQAALYAKLRAPFETIVAWQQLVRDEHDINEMLERLSDMSYRVAYKDKQKLLSDVKLALQTLSDSTSTARNDAWQRIRREIEPLHEGAS